MRMGFATDVACLSVIWLLGCVPKTSVLPSGDGGQGSDLDGGAATGSDLRADGMAATDAGGDLAPRRDASTDKPDPVFAPPEIVAERLGRMIWDAPADAEVIATLGAAVSRKSAGEAAARMLTDARARKGVAAFFRWWLLFEGPEPEEGSTRASLWAEGPALGTYLTVDVDGTFEDLLTAPYTFMNEELAKRYGVAGVSGPELRRVPFPPDQPRLGLLTTVGVLSYFSSLANPSWPAKRGWLITDPLLCSPITRTFLPIDPPDVTQSIRQQLIEKTSVCGGRCHAVLNGPGFAYIGFDADGRWHPEPGAAPNETEGWIPASIMPDAPTFDGPAELARLLVAREETRRCFVRQWMQFALARDAIITHDIAPGDEESVRSALDAFTASGLRLTAAIVAVAQTDAFLRSGPR